MHTIIGLVAALAATASLAPMALAHGEADWINQGGYRNAVGELCCGERDCAALRDTDVEVTAAGFHIRSLDETVPFDQALPSPDGHYWRCAWGGARKCFFAPPMGF
jgi:hypothetical protein